MAGTLSLVVLAAGIGSRYGGLKQVDPVGPNGELIIDYSIHDALAAGFARVVFVISMDIEAAFRERIGRTIERHCDTAYVLQRLDDLPAGFKVPEGRTKPWGTAHAVLSSRHAVHGPFGVINADDFYGRTAYQAIAGCLSSFAAGGADGTSEYCMVGYRLENTLTEHGHVARGVCEVDDGGFLVSAREITRIEKSNDGPRCLVDGGSWVPLARETIVSMNMWGLTPSIFDELAGRFPRFLAANRTTIDTVEFFLPTLVTDLIREEKARVRVLATEETWHGVTYAQDKPRVKAALQSLIAAGVYPARLWEA